MHTLEVQYGLLQLAEGLNFMHNNVKMRHGNINIDNVVIGCHGDWKLAGFNFAGPIDSEVEREREREREREGERGRKRERGERGERGRVIVIVVSDIITRICYH